GVEHHLHARLEALAAEMLLRHALGQAFALLAIGLRGRHVDAELLAGLAPFHRLLKARDDVAVAGKDGQRVPPLGTFHGLGALFCDRVVEADDAVFLDLHGGVSIALMGTGHYKCAFVAAALAASLLSACGSAPVRGPAATAAPARDWGNVRPADPAAANAVLMRAISLVGTPYRYGGNTPQGGFDCSGLVNYVFRDMLDLRLPRTSRQLSEYQGPRIAPRE